MQIIPKFFDMIRLFWDGITYLFWMAFVVYHFCVLYKIIKEVNIACEGDGEETTGLGFLFLLDYATSGVYSFIWCYKFGKRLAKNAPRYGMDFKNLGRTLLAAKISKGFFSLLFCTEFIFYFLFRSYFYAFRAAFFPYLTDAQWLLSVHVSMLACLVGVIVFHFVLMGIILKYTNKICAGYNAAHNL